MRCTKGKYTLVVLCFLIICLTVCTGCSGSQGHDNNPAVPDILSGTAYTVDIRMGTGRPLWGLWDAYIPASHDTIEFSPNRDAVIHLNARRFLEVDPCQSCITLQEFSITPNEIMKAVIQLRHPYPGKTRYTGFDVRALVITDGSLDFPALAAIVPLKDNGDFTLINQDGYTRLWNSIEFPEGSGDYKILEYSRGNLASPGTFSGTLNPFISYGQEPRNHFPAGQAMTRDFRFTLPDGEIRFGYAVDVSWELPSVDPPDNIETDFPSSANAMEASFDFWTPTFVPTSVVGSEGSVRVGLLDRQGFETVSDAWIECPDVWDGAVHVDEFSFDGTTEFGDQLSFEFNYVNEKGADPGSYRMLMRVDDQSEDHWLGNINHLYHMDWIMIKPLVSGNFKSEIIWIAPGEGNDSNPPPPNIWNYNLDTGVKTQLTNFLGCPYVIREPRINPAGTHHMHCKVQSSIYGNVRLYEFEGDDWEIETNEFDYSADFHPDGIHIITASGEQLGDTPDIYMMDYNGHGRELLATAPDCIQHLSISPDGTMIAATLGDEFSDPPTTSLWIYHLDGSGWQHKSEAPGFDRNPSWSPLKVGGYHRIAYESNAFHYPELDTDIYIISPFIEYTFRLDLGKDEQHPSFSPDGLSFIFNMDDPQGDSELYFCNWQENKVFKLTDNIQFDYSPSWSWNW